MLGGINEAGVCRALVLVWLSRGGGAPPEPTGANAGTIVEDVKEMMSSNSLVNCGVNTLHMKWAGDAREPAVAGGSKANVHCVKDSGTRALSDRCCW